MESVEKQQQWLVIMAGKMGVSLTSSVPLAVVWVQPSGFRHQAEALGQKSSVVVKKKKRAIVF